MKDTVTIMLGISGSGKSRLADDLYLKYLDKDGSVGRVSADYYFIPKTLNTFAGGDYLYVWNPEYLGQAHLMCQRQFEMLLNKIPHIIVDNTNLRFKDIAYYAEKAVANGYNVDIVEPNTCWKYHPIECFKRCQHNVPLEKIKEMLTSLSKLKLLHNDMLKNPTEHFKQGKNHGAVCMVD